ncbi:MAG: hypothetical protein ACOYN0_07795 [Phycisphaerales bacterium]
MDRRSSAAVVSRLATAPANTGDRQMAKKAKKKAKKKTAKKAAKKK